MSWIIKLGIEDHVDLLPPVSHEQLPALLQEADFFSCTHPFTKAVDSVLEAMKMGLPTVCSDIAPFHELYRDGIEYAPATDAYAWAKKIDELCRYPERSSDLAHCGVERANQSLEMLCGGASPAVSR
ncbi:MAG: glycosyltransferase [Planctomycetaceae bacterium]